MLKPLNGNVVIEPLEVERKTASGIILTGDIPTETYAEGLVIAAGPGSIDYNGGCGRLEMSVNPGDKVLFMNYGNRPALSQDGKNLIIIDQNEILAIVEEAK